MRSAGADSIIRVVPRRTSATPSDAFIGDPPLFLPKGREVHVSCTFTWDLANARRLVRAWGRFYDEVKLGGPALDDPGGDFVPGRYLRRGYTITTRGCPERCPFCLVPDREGPLRCLPIAAGHIVQDNNLLAAPRSHILAVLEMLREQPRAAIFSGGLDASRFTPKWLEAFQTIRIRELWFAYDQHAQRNAVRRAIRRCRAAGLSRRKTRCYALIGQPGDTPEKAESRLEYLWNWGALPFAMPWQPPDRYIRRNGQWQSLIRLWSRPAAMFASHREEVYP